MYDVKVLQRSPCLRGRPLKDESDRRRTDVYTHSGTQSLVFQDPWKTPFRHEYRLRHFGRPAHFGPFYSPVRLAPVIPVQVGEQDEEGVPGDPLCELKRL